MRLPPWIFAFPVITSSWLTSVALEIDWLREQLSDIGIQVVSETEIEAGGTRFSLTPEATHPPTKEMEISLVDNTGTVLFTVRNAHTYRHTETGDRVYREADLLVAPVLAQVAGHPLHAGLLAGSVTITVPWPEGDHGPIAAALEGSCDAGFGPTVDLVLTAVNNISQVAREPGTRVALTMDARLQNAGLFDIRWYWAIAPNLVGNGTNFGSHPYLCLSYYREANGSFRQIGRSDLKHAWNTVNSGCPCPSGQVMFVGCEDFYGMNNNAKQYYFSPRDELEAHTGDWTSLGSHFDGLPIDNERDHGFGEHDAFEHRLVVAEPDLQTVGATYYAEVWYLVPLDKNIFNSMGYRTATQELSDSNWAFSFTDDGVVNGPALNAWVDPASPEPNALNRIIDTSEGHLQLAVKTWANNDESTHYEYALLNLDYDRQVQSFSVPVATGVAVTNIGFNDLDTLATNNWIATIHPDRVQWDEVNNGFNALDWGMLYNFRFDADAAPSTNVATLTSLEPGEGAFLQEETLAPDPITDIRFEILNFSAPTNGGMTSWSAVSGAVYRVETADSLSPIPTWTTLGGPVTAQGASVTSPGSTQTRTQRSIRIWLEQLPSK